MQSRARNSGKEHRFKSPSDLGSNPRAGTERPHALKQDALFFLVLSLLVHKMGRITVLSPLLSWVIKGMAKRTA